MNKEIEKLMDKYGLTIKDLPVFPPKKIDLEKLIITIGEAKKKRLSN